ncbi:MAG TPA: hypothetical protein VKU91_01100, partial [Acidimicrobiales bacterium]|nr:hypothetical protein [Acidimicrobiales bacterium]
MNRPHVAAAGAALLVLGAGVAAAATLRPSPAPVRGATGSVVAVAAPAPTPASTRAPLSTTTTTTTKVVPTTTIPATTVPAPTTTTRPLPPACPPYPPATYGVDPNQLSSTGGGTQLVTVVTPSPSSRAGVLVAWARSGGCWRPVSFPAQPPAPFPAETGYGGLMPFSQRVSGDGATPTGLYPFGDVIYGNSDV